MTGVFQRKPFDYHRMMEESDAVRSFAALAQASRLRVFRALVVAGPPGLTPGVLAAQLGLPPATLSFHLKELQAAGLCESTRDGRNLIYRARYGQVDALIAYLTEHCCEGAACAVAPAGGCGC